MAIPEEIFIGGRVNGIDLAILRAWGAGGAALPAAGAARVFFKGERVAGLDMGWRLLAFWAAGRSAKWVTIPQRH
jgi:hypothetical protein